MLHDAIYKMHAPWIKVLRSVSGINERASLAMDAFSLGGDQTTIALD